MTPKIQKSGKVVDQRLQGELSEKATAKLLIAPAMLVIFGVGLIPVCYAIVMSVTNANLGGDNSFVGLTNYITVIAESKFWNSLKVTFYFTAVSIVLQITLGTLVALLLNQQFFGRSIMRAVVLLPWAVPTTVNAVLWDWIYTYNYGALNKLLLQLGIIDQGVIWMGTAFRAINMIIIADTWRMLPLYVLMILAPLQTVPEHMLEAAKVDGAGPFRRLWNITLPLIKPMLLVILVLRTTQAFKVFDIIYMITKGGPANGTMVISFYSYFETFSYFNFGNGSAIGVIVAAIIMCIALVYIRVLRSDDIY